MRLSQAAEYPQPEIHARTVPFAYTVFTGLMVAVAVTCSAVLAATLGWHIPSPGRFWLLAAFVLAGELLPIPVPRAGALDKVTISTAFAFAILLCDGVLPACAVYAAACVVADVSSRVAPVKVLFNAAE